MKLKPKYHIIREFTEFNAQRMNGDSVRPAMHVDNPQLSLNAFDKHQDILRTAMSRLGQLGGTLSGSSQFGFLKSKLGLEDQNLTSLSIIRIVKNNLKYDVYIKFMIGDREYWGVIKDITRNPELKSEVFKDLYLVQSKEWVIKMTGIIIKNIKSFLKPTGGKFKSLKEVICYSNLTGKMLVLNPGMIIEVLKSYDDKIIFEYDGDKYSLNGDNYIYFNWWFEGVV
jgi:hypothetical protein